MNVVLVLRKKRQREGIFLWVGRIGGCSRRSWVGLCIRGYVGRIGGWVGGVSVGVGRRWGVVGVGRDGVGSWWGVVGVSRDGVGRWRGVVVVVGGLGPTHLVTYIVVGAHVQLVHCASVLFHLWVLPATHGINLKAQLLEILCIQFIFHHFIYNLRHSAAVLEMLQTDSLPNLIKTGDCKKINFSAPAIRNRLGNGNTT